MYKRLKKILKEKNISEYRFAKEIGISQSSISMWKSRKGMPNALTLKKMAAYLDTSIDYLVDGKKSA